MRNNPNYSNSAIPLLSLELLFGLLTRFVTKMLLAFAYMIAVIVFSVIQLLKQNNYG